MTRSPRKLRRPAAAVMMALVVVLVVGLISSLSLKAILQSARQTREEHQRLQAELLADAALHRALQTLRHDGAWKGETWTVNIGNPSDINSKDDAKTPQNKSIGTADIRVQAKADEPESLKISVVAVYPADPVHRAQARRELTLTTSPRGEKP